MPNGVIRKSPKLVVPTRGIAQATCCFAAGSRQIPRRSRASPMFREFVVARFDLASGSRPRYFLPLLKNYGQRRHDQDKTQNVIPLDLLIQVES